MAAKDKQTGYVSENEREWNKIFASDMFFPYDWKTM